MKKVELKMKKLHQGRSGLLIGLFLIASFLLSAFGISLLAEPEQHKISPVQAMQYGDASGVAPTYNAEYYKQMADFYGCSIIAVPYGGTIASPTAPTGDYSGYTTVDSRALLAISDSNVLNGWSRDVGHYTGDNILIVVPDYVTAVGSPASDDDVTYTRHYMEGNTEKTEATRGYMFRNPSFQRVIGVVLFTRNSHLTSMGTAFKDSEIFHCTLPQKRTDYANVTSIPASAFSGCSLLREVVIPDSVTYIGKQAFNGCSMLAHFSVPSGITGITTSTADNATGIYYNSSSASTGAFYNTRNLVEVEAGASGFAQDEAQSAFPALLHYFVRGSTTKSNMFIDTGSQLRFCKSSIARSNTLASGYGGTTTYASGEWYHVGYTGGEYKAEGTNTYGEKLYEFPNKNYALNVTRNDIFFDYYGSDGKMYKNDFGTEKMAGYNINNSCYSYVWITRVKFGTGLKVVGNSAFSSSHLQYADIPAATTAIGSSGFACGSSVNTKQFFYIHKSGIPMASNSFTISSGVTRAYVFDNADMCSKEKTNRAASYGSSGAVFTYPVNIYTKADDGNEVKSVNVATRLHGYDFNYKKVEEKSNAAYGTWQRYATADPIPAAEGCTQSVWYSEEACTNKRSNPVSFLSSVLTDATGYTSYLLYNNTSKETSINLYTKLIDVPAGLKGYEAVYNPDATLTFDDVARVNNTISDDFVVDIAYFANANGIPVINPSNWPTEVHNAGNYSIEIKLNPDKWGTWDHTGAIISAVITRQYVDVGTYGKLNWNINGEKLSPVGTTTKLYPYANEFYTWEQGNSTAGFNVREAYMRYTDTEHEMLLTRGEGVPTFFTITPDPTATNKATLSGQYTAAFRITMDESISESDNYRFQYNDDAELGVYFSRIDEYSRDLRISKTWYIAVMRNWFASASEPGVTPPEYEISTDNTLTYNSNETIHVPRLAIGSTSDNANIKFALTYTPRTTGVPVTIVSTDESARLPVARFTDYINNSMPAGTYKLTLYAPKIVVADANNPLHDAAYHAFSQEYTLVVNPASLGSLTAGAESKSVVTIFNEALQGKTFSFTYDNTAHAHDYLDYANCTSGDVYLDQGGYLIASALAVDPNSKRTASAASNFWKATAQNEYYGSLQLGYNLGSMRNGTAYYSYYDIKTVNSLFTLVDPDTYEVFYQVDVPNYVSLWDRDATGWDSTRRDYVFTTVIIRDVAPQEIDSIEYCNALVEPAIEFSRFYTHALVDADTYIEVGTYYVLFTLTDPEHMRWTGVDSSNLLNNGATARVSFEIVPALNSWTLDPKVIEWTYDGFVSSVNQFTAKPKFGTVVTYTVTGGSIPAANPITFSITNNAGVVTDTAVAARLKALPVATYTLTCSVEGTDNYEEFTPASITFGVNKTANRWVDTPNVVRWTWSEFSAAQNVFSATPYYTQEGFKVLYSVHKRDNTPVAVDFEVNANGEVTDAAVIAALAALDVDNYYLSAKYAAGDNFLELEATEIPFMVFRAQNYWETSPSIVGWQYLLFDADNNFRNGEPHFPTSGGDFENDIIYGIYTSRTHTAASAVEGLTGFSYAQLTAANSTYYAKLVSLDVSANDYFVYAVYDPGNSNFYKLDYISSFKVAIGDNDWTQRPVAYTFTRNAATAASGLTIPTARYGDVAYVLSGEDNDGTAVSQTFTVGTDEGEYATTAALNTALRAAIAALKAGTYSLSASVAEADNGFYHELSAVEVMVKVERIVTEWSVQPLVDKTVTHAALLNVTSLTDAQTPATNSPVAVTYSILNYEYSDKTLAEILAILKTLEPNTYVVKTEVKANCDYTAISQNTTLLIKRDANSFEDSEGNEIELDGATLAFTWAPYKSGSATLTGNTVNSASADLWTQIQDLQNSTAVFSIPAADGFSGNLAQFIAKVAVLNANTYTVNVKVPQTDTFVELNATFTVTVGKIDNGWASNMSVLSGSAATWVWANGNSSVTFTAPKPLYGSTVSIVITGSTISGSITFSLTYDDEGELSDELVSAVENRIKQLGVGSYTVTATVQEGTNWKGILDTATGSKADFSVTIADNAWQTDHAPSISNWTFGSNPNTPTAIPLYGDVNAVVFTYYGATKNAEGQYVLTNGNYTIDMNDAYDTTAPTAAGEYFLYAHLAADSSGNYKALTGTYHFSILQSAGSWISTPSVIGWEYGLYDRNKNVFSGTATSQGTITYRIIAPAGITIAEDNVLSTGFTLTNGIAPDAAVIELKKLVPATYTLSATAAANGGYLETTATSPFEVRRATNSWDKSPNVVAWKWDAFNKDVNFFTADPLYGDATDVVYHLYKLSDDSRVVSFKTDEDGRILCIVEIDGEGNETVKANSQAELALLLKGLSASNDNTNNYYIVAKVAATTLYSGVNENGSNKLNFTVGLADNGWDTTPAIRNYEYGAFVESLLTMGDPIYPTSNATVTYTVYLTSDYLSTPKGAEKFHFTLYTADVAASFNTLGAEDYTLVVSVAGEANKYAALVAEKVFIVTVASNRWTQNASVSGWEYDHYSASANWTPAIAYRGTPSYTLTKGGVAVTPAEGQTVIDLFPTLPVGNYVLTVTVAGVDNQYESISGTVSFSVTITNNEWIDLPTMESWTYGDTAKTHATPKAKYNHDADAYEFVYYQAEFNPLTSEFELGTRIGTTRPSGAGCYILRTTLAGTENVRELSYNAGFYIYQSGNDWDQAPSASTVEWTWNASKVYTVSDVTVTAQHGRVKYSILGGGLDEAIIAYNAADFTEDDEDDGAMKLGDAVKLLNAGTYKITVTVLSDGDYAALNGAITLNIKKASNEWKGSSSLSYTKGAATATWSDPKESKYSATTYSNATIGSGYTLSEFLGKVKELGAGSYPITVTAAGTVNYESDTTIVTLTVNKATNEWLTDFDIGSGWTWNNGDVSKSAIGFVAPTVKYGTTVRFTISRTGMDDIVLTLTYDEDGEPDEDRLENIYTRLKNLDASANAYTISAMAPEGTDWYQLAAGGITFTVSQATNTWATDGTPAIESWKYGETAKNPTATPKFGRAIDIVYTYYEAQLKENSTTEYEKKSTTPISKPESVGHYILEATLAGSNNYSAIAATSCVFHISAGTPAWIAAVGVSGWEYAIYEKDTNLFRGTATSEGAITYTIETTDSSALPTGAEILATGFSLDANGKVSSDVVTALNLLTPGTYTLNAVAAAKDDYGALEGHGEFVVRKATNSWDQSPNVVAWNWDGFVRDTHLFTADPVYGDATDVNYMLYNESNALQAYFKTTADGKIVSTDSGVSDSELAEVLSELPAGRYYIVAYVTNTALYSGINEGFTNKLYFNIGLADNRWIETPTLINEWIYGKFTSGDFVEAIVKYGNDSPLKNGITYTVYNSSDEVEFTFNRYTAVYEKKFRGLNAGTYTFTASVAGTETEYKELAFTKSFAVTVFTNDWETRLTLAGGWKYLSFPGWTAPIPIMGEVNYTLTLNGDTDGTVFTPVTGTTTERDFSALEAAFAALEVGTYTLKYSATGSENQYTTVGERSVTIIIEKADNGWKDGGIPTINSWVYQQTPPAPNPADPIYGEEEDIDQKFYAATSDGHGGWNYDKNSPITNPTAVGTYVFVTYIAASKNYNELTYVAPFTITADENGWLTYPADNLEWTWHGTDNPWTDCTASGGQIVYTISGNGVSLTAYNAGDATGDYIRDVLDGLNAGYYSILARAVSGGNYEDVEPRQITLNVKKDHYTWSGADAVEFTYTGSSLVWKKNGAASTITLASAPAYAGLTSAEIMEYVIGSVSCATESELLTEIQRLTVGTYTISAVAKEKTNFAGETKTLTLTILPASNTWSDASKYEFNIASTWSWANGTMADSVIAFVAPKSVMSNTVYVTITGSGIDTISVTVSFSAVTGDADTAQMTYVLQRLKSLSKGTYTISVAAAEVDNYTAPTALSKDFEVTQGTNEWRPTPSIGGWAADGETPVPVGGAKYGEVKFVYYTAYLDGDNLPVKTDETHYQKVGESSTIPPKNAGGYILVAEVTATTNYTGLYHEVFFTISQGSGSWIAPPTVIGWEYNLYDKTKNIFTASAMSGTAVKFWITTTSGSALSDTTFPNIKNGFYLQANGTVSDAVVAELNQLAPAQYILHGYAEGSGNIGPASGQDSRFYVEKATNSWVYSPKVVAWKWDGFNASSNLFTATPKYGTPAQVKYTIYDSAYTKKFDVTVNAAGQVTDTVTINKIKALPAGTYYVWARFEADSDAYYTDINTYDHLNVSTYDLVDLVIGEAENIWQDTPNIRGFSYSGFAASLITKGVAKYEQSTSVVYSVWGYDEDDELEEVISDFTYSELTALNSSVVTAFNALKAGDYVLKIQVDGVTHYFGDLSAEKAFSVSVADNVWDPAGSISGWEYGSYAGNFSAPSAKHGTVSYKLMSGSTEIEPEEGHTVLERLSTLGAGSYVLTASVAGSTGYYNPLSKDFSFTVSKKANNWQNNVEPTISSWEYCGTESTPVAALPVYGTSAGTGALVQKYYVATYDSKTQSWTKYNEDEPQAKPTSAGHYVLVSTVDGGTNYEDLIHVCAFEITRSSNSWKTDHAPMASTQWTWNNGTSVVFTVAEATYGSVHYTITGGTLTEGVSATNAATGEGNKNIIDELKKLDAGSYRVSVVVAATDDYDGLSEVVMVTVNKAANSWTGDNAVSYTKYEASVTGTALVADYGTTTYAISGTSHTSVAVSALDGIIKTLPANSYTITATTAGTTNYSADTQDIALVVSKAANSWSTELNIVSSMTSDKSWTWNNGNVTDAAIGFVAPKPSRGTSVTITIKRTDKTVDDIVLTLTYDSEGVADSVYLNNIKSRLKNLDAGEYKISASVAEGSDWMGIAAGAGIAFTVEKAENEWTDGPSIANWNFGDEAKTAVAEPKYGREEDVKFVYYNTTLTDGSYVKTGSSFVDKPSAKGVYYMVATLDETDNYGVLTGECLFHITAGDARWTTPIGVSSWEFGLYDIDTNLFRGASVSGGTVTYKVEAAEGKTLPAGTTVLTTGFTLTNGKVSAEVKAALDLLTPDTYVLKATAAAGGDYGEISGTGELIVRKATNSWRYSPKVVAWNWDGFNVDRNLVTATPKYRLTTDVNYVLYDASYNEVISFTTDATGKINTAAAITKFESKTFLAGTYYLWASVAETSNYTGVNLYANTVAVSDYDLVTVEIGVAENVWVTTPNIRGWSYGGFTASLITEAETKYTGKNVLYTIYAYDEDDELTAVTGLEDLSYATLTSTEKVAILNGLKQGKYALIVTAANEANKYAALSNPAKDFTVGEVTNDYTSPISVSDWTYGTTPAFTAPVPLRGTVSYTLKENGTALTPEEGHTVLDLLPTLQAGTYQLFYSVAGDSGKYTAIAEQSVSFKVLKAVPEWTTEPSHAGWKYTTTDSEKKDPVHGVLSVEGLTVTERYYNASYDEASNRYSYDAGSTPLAGKPTNVGHYVFVTSVDGGRNYESISFSSGFSITKLSNRWTTAPTTETVRWTWGDEGNSWTHPVPLVGEGGRTGGLVYKISGNGITDPIVTDEANVKSELDALDAGVYKVTVEVSESTNYTGISGAIALNIERTNNDWTGSKTISYTKYAATVTWEARKAVQGTTTYAISGTGYTNLTEQGLKDEIKNLNAGTYTVTATAAGTTNYSGGTDTITVTVNKAANEWMTPALSISSSWTWANGEVDSDDIDFVAPKIKYGDKIIFTIRYTGTDKTVDDVVVEVALKADGTPEAVYQNNLLDRLKKLSAGTYKIIASVEEGVNHLSPTANAEKSFEVLKATNSWKTGKQPTIADWIYGNAASQPSAEPVYGDVVKVVFTYYSAKLKSDNSGNYERDGSVLPERPSETGAYILVASYTAAADDNFGSIAETEHVFHISAGPARWTTPVGVSDWEFSLYNQDSNRFRGASVSGGTVTYKISRKDGTALPAGTSNLTSGFTLTGGVVSDTIATQLNLLVPGIYKLDATAAANGDYGSIDGDYEFEIRKATNSWRYSPKIVAWKWDGFNTAVNLVTATPYYGAMTDVNYVLYDASYNEVISFTTDATGKINTAAAITKFESKTFLAGTYYLWASVAETSNYTGVNLYANTVAVSDYDLVTVEIGVAENSWDTMPNIRGYDFGGLDSGVITLGSPKYGKDVTPDVTYIVKSASKEEFRFTVYNSDVEDKFNALVRGDYTLTATVANAANKYAAMKFEKTFAVAAVTNDWDSTINVVDWTYGTYRASTNWSAPVPKRGTVSYTLTCGGKTITPDANKTVIDKFASLDAGTYVLKYSVAGVEGKYSAIPEASVTFTVNKALNSWEDDIAPSIESWKYNDTPKTALDAQPTYKTGAKQEQYFIASYDEIKQSWTMYNETQPLSGGKPSLVNRYVLVTTVPGGTNYEDLVYVAAFEITMCGNEWVNGTDPESTLDWVYGDSDNEWTNAEPKYGKNTVVYTITGKEIEETTANNSNVKSKLDELDAGVYRIVVSVASDGNYEGLSDVITLNISRTDDSWLGDNTLAYTKYQTEALTWNAYRAATGTTLYSISGGNGNNLTANEVLDKIPTLDAGIYTISATSSGSANYSGETKSVSLTVSRADNEWTTAVSTSAKWSWQKDGGVAASAINLVVPVPKYGSVATVTIKRTDVGNADDIVLSVRYDEGAPESDYVSALLARIQRLNAGKYTISATVAQGTNWNALAETTASFEVEKALNGWVVGKEPAMTKKSWAYGAEAGAPVSTVEALFGTVSVMYYTKSGSTYNNPTPVMPETVGTYGAGFSVAADVNGNYGAVSVTYVDFSITAQKLKTFEALSVRDWTWNEYNRQTNRFVAVPSSGGEVTIKIKDSNGSVVIDAFQTDGSGEIPSTSTELLSDINGLPAGNYVMSVHVAANGNYDEFDDETQEFTVKPGVNYFSVAPYISPWVQYEGYSRINVPKATAVYGTDKIHYVIYKATKVVTPVPGEEDEITYVKDTTSKVYYDSADSTNELKTAAAGYYILIATLEAEATHYGPDIEQSIVFEVYEGSAEIPANRWAVGKQPSIAGWVAGDTPNAPFGTPMRFEKVTASYYKTKEDNIGETDGDPLFVDVATELDSENNLIYQVPVALQDMAPGYYMLILVATNGDRDGDMLTERLPFQIAYRKNDWVDQPTMDSWYYGKEAQDVVYSALYEEEGTTEVVITYKEVGTDRISTEKPVTPGDYTVTVKLTAKYSLPIERSTNFSILYQQNDWVQIPRMKNWLLTDKAPTVEYVARFKDSAEISYRPLNAAAGTETTEMPTKPGEYYVVVKVLYRYSLPLQGETTFKITYGNNSWIETPSIANWVLSNPEAPVPAFQAAYCDSYKVTYKPLGADVSAEKEIIPNTPGEYEMIVRVWKEGCEVLEGSSPFSVQLGTINWVETPSVEGWSQGSTPTVPVAVPDVGKVSYYYVAEDGTIHEEMPTKAGTYTVVATAYMEGYEPLITKTTVKIGPPYSIELLIVDIVLGLCACGLSILTIVYAIRRNKQ